MPSRWRIDMQPEADAEIDQLVSRFWLGAVLYTGAAPEPLYSQNSPVDICYPVMPVANSNIQV